MDYFKNLLIGLVTGIAAYLNPISGEIKSLIAVFALNFICGLLTALLINHESFSFKKAWRCIVEATIFFALVSCIYFIGEHKGNPEVHLQAVNRIVTNEGTYHVDVSMGKVNQFDNPINHGISKGK